MFIICEQSRILEMDRKLDKILKRLSQATGLSIRVQSYWFLASIDKAYDASIAITIGNKEYPYWITYRGKTNPPGSFEQEFNVIAIGEFTNQQKSKFIEKNLSYVSKDGDYSLPIRLSNDSSKFEIKKQKPNLTYETEPIRNFTSSKAMAKLVHLLLSTSKGPKKNQRAIASELDISLASVNKYLKELQAADYIVKDVKKIRFTNLRKILDLWTSEYTKKILPKLKTNYFEAMDENQKRNLRTNPVKLEHGYWGASKAADRLLSTELPSKLLIYSDRPKELIKELKLRPSESGNIGVREKFWKHEWPGMADGIVDLPLIYADLKESTDPRDSKVAEEIRELWLNSET
ncbi:MAG: winged helix-turn-helix transcriptional regulator [Proteobacteria bacterium]|nr:MAG: winged helix-turn-helix transcriptional regulator [Pseudomonadota bacterium]